MADMLRAAGHQVFTPTLTRDPVLLANALGNGLACTYLACTNPPYPVVRSSHEQARSRADWTYKELPTGHAAMVMAPSLVIEALLGAAPDG